jgi:hypothetical protein
MQLISNYICTDKAYILNYGRRASPGNHLCLQNIQCTVIAQELMQCKAIIDSCHEACQLISI